MAAKKSVLITGCSEGSVGDALARAFHNAEFRAIATARNPKKMAHFADLGIETVVLDVQSKESIDAAMAKVSELTDGKLDMLINNSGGIYAMPVLDADMSQVKELFDLNVFSQISITQAFIPLLIQAAPGSVIVNHTSIASICCVPGQSIYSATKAAMALLTDGLRLEVSPFGVKVVELKSGSIKTRLFANQAASGATKLPPDSRYNPAKEAVEEAMDGKTVLDNATDVDVWAKQVVADLTRANPPERVYRGANAWFLWFARTFLPASALDGQLAKLGGMSALAQKLRG